MSYSDSIDDEIEEVECGMKSIDDCDYYDNVSDELRYSQFDDDGYIIDETRNYSSFDENRNNNQLREKPTKNSSTCMIITIIFLIFVVWCLV